MCVKSQYLSVYRKQFMNMLSEIATLFSIDVSFLDIVLVRKFLKKICNDNLKSIIFDSILNYWASSFLFWNEIPFYLFVHALFISWNFQLSTLFPKIGALKMVKLYMYNCEIWFIFFLCSFPNEIFVDIVFSESKERKKGKKAWQE